MSEVIHVGTVVFKKAHYSENITDMRIVDTPVGLLLAAVSNKGAGLTIYKVQSASSPVSIFDWEGQPPLKSYFSAPHLEVIEASGTHWLVMTGQQDSLMWGVRHNNNGGWSKFLPLFSAGQLPANIVALNVFEMDGLDYLAVGRDGNMQLKLFSLEADAQVRSIGQAAPAGPMPVDSEYTDIEIFNIGASHFAAGASARGDMLALYRIDNSGPTLISQVDGSNEIGISAPREVVTVATADGTFLIASGGESSSLSVFHMTASGGMRLTDHVIDSGYTRFQAATAMASVVVDGRAFIFVGGADDGLSVMTLDGQGRLILLTGLIDTDELALADVSAIEARVIDGKVAVFVTSATERGISHFSFDPGNVGASEVGSGQINGTARDDILIGAGDKALVLGGSGDDILIARTGAVELRGGPGVDTFIPGYGASKVTIKDFTKGQDRIDLSELAFVRSIAQLQLLPTVTGALLLVQETRIDILTADGKALRPGDFTDAMFRLAHYANDIDFSKLVDPVSPDPDRPGTLDPGGTGTDHQVPNNGERYWAPPPLPPPTSMANPQFGTARADRLVVPGTAMTINALAGDDVIIGHRERDNLLGGHGNDTIFGGADMDFIRGEDGRDSLMGQLGADRIYGGAGGDYIAGGPDNDRLFGQAGSDTIYGQDGRDVIWGGDGGDVLRGGPGMDLLVGVAGPDTIDGGPDHDWLIGAGGNNRIIGGEGNDLIQGWGFGNVLIGDGGNDSVYGGMGRDYVFLNDGDDRGFGRGGDDFIIGNRGNDLILGGDGNDHLIGHDDHDTLWGGNGDDILWGVAGRDKIVGQTGNDSLRGGDESDTLWGGPGDDFIWGGDGSDLMQGDGGIDVMFGENGNDILKGGGGADLLRGGLGDDELQGGAGNDELYGGLGNDLIDGDHGNDRLIGSSGNDLLRGGVGADTMTGGAGEDVFVFAPGDKGGVDIITDFVAGTDKVDLSLFPGNLTWTGGEALSGLGRAELRVLERAQGSRLIIDGDGDGRGDVFVDVQGHVFTPEDLLF
ncbi:MAG: calcium-binding protein [Paracoccus sp. (in: a-proteobacteria)]